MQFQSLPHQRLIHFRWQLILLSQLENQTYQIIQKHFCQELFSQKTQITQKQYHPSFSILFPTFSKTHLLLPSLPYLQNLIDHLILEKHFQIVLPMLAIIDTIMVAYNLNKNNSNELLYAKFFLLHSLHLYCLVIVHLLL